MAYFGHFRALQKYNFLWCLLFPYKIWDESTPNYEFLTPENGPKSHFSSQNGIFFGVLTHFKNSLRDIFWWNFLLPIKIEVEDYGRKKFHGQMASENMFFWTLKMVRKFNFFVEKGIFLHFREFRKCPSGHLFAIFFVARHNRVWRVY